MSTTTPRVAVLQADTAALPAPRARQAPGGAEVAGPAVALAAAPRPLLRGWLHAGFAPVVAVAGLVLLAHADRGAEVVAVGVYAAVSLALFATSALYHRRGWSPAAQRRVKQLDHGNIPLVVAASATPLLVLGVPGRLGTRLLVALWVAALLVAVSRWVWPDCPRRLHTAGTAALGWGVVPVLPLVATSGAADGIVVVALVAASGALLTAGAVVYATRRPEPWPRWAGHHEVFHALTVLAWPLHAAAVWLLCD